MKKFWKSDKDKGTSAPPTDNPYAQQGSQPDPYSGSQPTPDSMAGGYQRGGGLPSGPRPGGGGLPGRPSPRAGGGGAPSGGGSGYGASPAPSSGSGYGMPAPSMSSAGGYPSSNTSKYSGSTSGGGYGSDKYGAPGGYGSDRYGSGGPQGGGGGGGGARGPGGYGGLGGGNNDDDDASRDALFGAKKRPGPGADDRYRQPVAAGRGDSGYGGGGGGGGRWQDPNRDALLGGARERLDARDQAEQDNLYGSGGASAVDGGSYGGYGEERELTEEEKQEMQIRAVKDKTRQVRQKDIDSLARTEQLGLQSLETVQASMARLGHQNDRLANAERNLDRAVAQNEETRVHVNDLKRINNGGMLSSLAKNPFAKGKRASDREAAAVRRKQEAAETQEETKQGQIAMNSQTARIVGSIQQRRNKYEYEDDEEIPRDKLDQAYLGEGAEDEDYGQEAEIERKLRSIEYISHGLNDASKQFGKYVDESAPQLERTARKAERADIGIARNHNTMREVR